ncbi:hypothetical protein MUP32_00705, partial [Candidatus Microgenomates bacterium]|nr:hypothetical protein [Candidatus Microgenomates bacterium]
MKKYFSILIIALLFFFIFFTQEIQAQTNCETRATWLNTNSFSYESRRKTTLPELLNAHINTVFLSAWPLNGNYGRGSQESFETMLNQLVSNNISVHVWIDNRFRRFLNDGTNQVDFTNPTEQDTQAQWAADWIKTYPQLDGVHFDYIRYAPNDADTINMNGRMDGVTATIIKTRNAINAINPQKKFTAAVFKLYPSWEESYRDPPSWSKGDVPKWFKDWYTSHPDESTNIYRHVASATTPPFYYVAVPNFFLVQQDPIEWLKQDMDGIS